MYIADCSFKKGAGRDGGCELEVITDADCRLGGDTTDSDKFVSATLGCFDWMPRKCIGIAVGASTLEFDSVVKDCKFGDPALFYSSKLSFVDVTQGIVVCVGSHFVAKKIVAKLFGEGHFSPRSSSFSEL